MIKNLIYKIRWRLYKHYSRKAYKHMAWCLGARRYSNDKSELKCTLNSLYGESCYMDTDSVKVDN
ncbi:MAG: hypothetical protein J6T10_11165 [Methanobrevibacter sp.]|nr:hypothetical protein [Methanobrevibacter sp.]